MPLATAAAKDQGKVPSTSISRSGTPAAARMPATVRSSVQSAAVSPRSGWSGRSNIHRPSVPAGTKTSMSSRVDDHVQGVAIGGDVPGEVGTEHRAQVSALVAEDLDVQPGQAPDGAVGAVGADDPARLDGLVRAHGRLARGR